MAGINSVGASTYRHFIIVQRDLALHGFVLRTRDEYFYVGVDTTHEKWKDWGLVSDNELSGALTTLGAVEAWADGFLAYRQFLSLAVKA